MSGSTFYEKKERKKKKEKIRKCKKIRESIHSFSNGNQLSSLEYFIQMGTDSAIAEWSTYY